jgi:hypothetical protein
MFVSFFLVATIMHLPLHAPATLLGGIYILFIIITGAVATSAGGCFLMEKYLPEDFKNYLIVEQARQGLPFKSQPLLTLQIQLAKLCLLLQLVLGVFVFTGH